MKNIPVLTLLLALFLLNTSCENDGGSSNLNLKNGAMPDFKLAANSDDFINLNDIDNLSLQFSVGIGAGNPTSFDLKAFYQTAAGAIYGPITLDANVTTFPKDYTLTGPEIIAAFSELNSAADVNIGDVLKLYTSFTFADGSVIELLNKDGSPNYYAADFDQIPDFTLKLDFAVACPSDLAGSYTVVSNGMSTDGGPTPDENPLVDYSYNVVITADGGGNYTISDGVAGVYILWYDIYGYTFETAGNFTDICDSLSGSWTDAFGATINLTGTANADGTLSITWINDFGDTADAVYTPQ